MKLSSEMRNMLVREIHYAVDNMKNSQNINDKIYFCSAVYAMIDRVFNIEYDPELVFIHQVVRQAFDTISAKINLASQKDLGIGTSIPTNLFEKLYDCLDELAYNIEKDQNNYTVLQNIANIGYSTTGNGSYLMVKGLLKL